MGSRNLRNFTVTSPPQTITITRYDKQQWAILIQHCGDTHCLRAVAEQISLLCVLLFVNKFDEILIKFFFLSTELEIYAQKIFRDKKFFFSFVWHVDFVFLLHIKTQFIIMFENVFFAAAFSSLCRVITILRSCDSVNLLFENLKKKIKRKWWKKRK